VLEDVRKIWVAVAISLVGCAVYAWLRSKGINLPAGR
jgi:hypothetical protein